MSEDPLAHAEFSAAMARLKTTRDPIRIALAFALQEMEQRIHADGWDNAPQLYFARRKLGMGSDGVLTAFLFSPVGPPMWELDGPQISGQLYRLAQRVTTDADAPPVPDDIFCWALCSEAFGAFGQRAQDPDVAEQVNAAARLRQPLPNSTAQELRMIVAVERTGAAMQILRVRDTDKVYLFTVEDEGHLSGGLVQALTVLMNATLGDVTIPATEN